MSPSGERVLTVCRAVLALFVVLGGVGKARAQNGIEHYIAQAESLYVLGDTERPAQVLSPVLGNLTGEQAVRAYRILILSRMQDSSMVDASTAALRLLYHAPTYQPDPLDDPPAYVTFITAIRSALASTPETNATCSDVLTASASLYLEGAYEEAEEALSECLNQQLMYMPEAGYVPALRLLSLLYLKMGDVAEARWTVGKLLKLKPSYTADPVQDPPAYLALVEIVRSGSVR